MALTIWAVDGFDYLPSTNPHRYLDGQWTISGTNPTRVDGRGGQGYGLRIPNGTFITKSLTGLFTTISGGSLARAAVIGFAVKISGYPSSNSTIAKFYNSGTQEASIRVSPGGSLEIHLQTMAATRYTWASSLPLNEWRYLEAAYGGFVDSGGYARGAFNGAVEGTDVSGGDTRTGTGSAFDVSEIRLQNSLGAGVTVDFDDFYLADDNGVADTFAGNVQVLTRQVVANGGTNAWTRFGGGTANYENVDEFPTPSASNDGTDVEGVETSTSGARELYAPDSFGLGAERTVTAVGVRGWARTSAASTVRLVTAEGASSSVSASVGLSATYSYAGRTFNSPAGGGAWTSTKLEASKYGIERV